jgi:hypothetical protein
MMNEIFSTSHAAWVRHDDYELRHDGFNDPYIRPMKNSKATLYNPVDQVRDIAIDALNLGREIDVSDFDAKTMMGQIRRFVCRYGFLGVMVDIPLNDNFYRVAETYFTPNPFFPIDKKMDTQEYMAKFFPFEETVPELEQTDTSISAYAGRGPVYEYVFSGAYSERLAWYVSYFQNLYTLFDACMKYVDEPEVFRAMVYRTNILRYSDHKLRYNISAAGRPEICWEFASMKSVIDLFVVSCITDPAQPIRRCKHCGKIFYREDLRMEFCSPQCRNRFNVYKSRAKEK